MGLGTAWSGRLACNEECRRVRIFLGPVSQKLTASTWRETGNANVSKMNDVDANIAGKLYSR